MSQPLIPVREDWPERGTLAGLLLLAALLPSAWSKLAAATYFAPKFALVVLIAVWLAASIALRAIWSRQFAKPRGAHIAMGLFVAWTALAALTSTSAAVSFLGRANYGEGLVSAVAYGVIFYAASSIAWTTRNRGRLTVALALGGLVLAAICGFQLAGRDDLLLSLGLAGMGERGRITGTLGNPVFLGGYVAVVFPLFVTSALAARKRITSTAWGLLSIVMLFFAVASLTRASWLGIGAALVVFVWLARHALADRRTQAVVLVAAMVLVVAAAVAGFGTARGGTVSARVASLAKPDSGSGAARLGHWAIALRMAAERPLLGWGPSQYRLGFDRYATVSLLSLEAATSNDAHNMLLNAAATTGVVGALLLLGVLVTIATGAANSWQPTDGNRVTDEILLRSGTVAAVVGYLVWAQLNPSSVGVTPLFWMLAGTLIPAATVRIESSFAASAQSKLMATIAVAAVALILAALPLRYLAADQAELAGIVAGSPADSEAAVQLNPFMPSYWTQLASAYRRQALDTKNTQPLNNSKAALGRALALSREFDVYVHMAATETMAGEMTKNPDAYRLAARHLKEALRLRPLSGIARFNLGYEYFMLGDYANAAKYLEAATRIPPPDAKSHLLLGQSLEKTGDLRRAAAAYRETLKVDPANTEAQERLRALASGPK